MGGIVIAGVASLHCTGDDVRPFGDDVADAAPDGGAPGLDGAPSADGGGDAGSTLPPLDNAVSVSAGRAHTCVVTDAQDVLCWGTNASGQLGVPVAQVARSSRPVKVDLGGKATAVAAGGDHTCAILTDGSIKCWGKNESGQLGRGSQVATGGVDLVQPPPDATQAELWTKAEVLTAGASFTCAGMHKDAASSGNVDRAFFCWGDDLWRQLATSSSNGGPITRPYLVTIDASGNANQALEGFAIAAGADFTCAGAYVPVGVNPASGALCWGRRDLGQIGAPPVSNGFDAEPGGSGPLLDTDASVNRIYGPLNATGLVAAGAAHGCVRLGGGGQSLLCWGNDTHGQAGAKVAGFHLAAPVSGVDSAAITALAAGGDTTCIIASGKAQCIGANDVGQLGRGTPDANPNATFADVASLPPSGSAIAVGASHSCVVLGAAAGQKGQVACWGQNQQGQLGDGFDIDAGYPNAPDPMKRVRATPVRVVVPAP